MPHAALVPADAGPDPFEAFKLRSWARALLWAEGLLDLHEAVDGLAQAADLCGLDTDTAQSVMSAAFRAVR